MKNRPRAKPPPCRQSSALYSADPSAISIRDNKPPLCHAGNYRLRSRTPDRIGYISGSSGVGDAGTPRARESSHRSGQRPRQARPGNSDRRRLRPPAALTHLYYLNNWSPLLRGSTCWWRAFGNKYLIAPTREKSSDGLRCDSRSVY